MPELAIDREMELALEIAAVAVDLEHDQAVAELALAQVVAEREHGPVEAVLARGHRRAQLAVALGTKSVTVAHRHDLPPLAAEDLAAAVETSLGPAATEAVVVWEAADSMVAGAAEGDAAAVGDKHSMRKNK